MVFLTSITDVIHCSRALAAGHRVTLMGSWTRRRDFFEKQLLRRGVAARFARRVATATSGALLLCGCATVGSDAMDTPSLTVEITTTLGQQARFAEGDVVRFLISLERPAFVQGILEDAAGRLTQIYPSAENLDSQVVHPAGRYMSIPSDRAGYPVVAPFGREVVWLIASDRPLPRFGVARTGSLVRIDGTVAQWQAKLEVYAARCGCALGKARVEFTTQPADFHWPP